MRSNALLFVALFVSAAALKGQTTGLRRHVQEAPLPQGQPKVVGSDPKGVPQTDPKVASDALNNKKGDPNALGASGTDPKTANEPKALNDPKADPKADTKGKDSKKKKCKTVKKTKGALTFDESAQYPAQAPLAAPEEKYCLQGERTEAECAAAANAQAPNTDKKVKGSISLEITSSDKNAKQLQQDAKAFLGRKTSHAFIGCAAPSRRAQQESSEIPPPVEEESVEVTGLDFDSFTNGECEIADAAGCSKVEANVDIYYNGEEISKPKQDEMFSLLMETISSQVMSGEFQNEVGTLHAIEANNLSSDSAADAGASGSDGDSAKKSIPSGVIVGLLAVVAGVFGYNYHKKRKARAAAAHEGKNHETDDSDNEGAVEVHATLVEETDEKKSWFAKKE